ncbi:hypothetical protein [Metallosphaera sedula]|uniref:hypothetical protein n=1 Tax=Metallosphaera sedula TaxID=43687 RepID=UPI0020BFBFB7|nr:hypothetical protein [Metallosphaera sedula]BBL45990.1 hypothetical protein MJ1HA_0077 [Metallosphaera sedula]
MSRRDAKALLEIIEKAIQEVSREVYSNAMECLKILEQDNDHEVKVWAKEFMQLLERKMKEAEQNE